MKCFHCAKCGMMTFFENDHCVKCNLPLGFAPDTLDLLTLAEAPEGQWQAMGSGKSGKLYRHCANRKQHDVCNWLVAAGDSNDWCVACRLNQVIPNLAEPRNIQRWARLELAKRRVIYTFLKLGLPVLSTPQNSRPALRFQFLEDKPEAPVKTGHENGLITINVAEADDDERERRRVNLHEPYRTLVGHFRHETGHYYWDLLIANSSDLPGFRELFGDETASYDAALQKYYQQGPPADWAEKMVTPYASAHPWEDWAETWAHYLHIMNTLELAAAFGVRITESAPAKASSLPVKYNEEMDLDKLLAELTPLVCALNAINRSMGLSDLYPFVIPSPVVEKLKFIHALVLKQKNRK